MLRTHSVPARCHTTWRDQAWTDAWPRILERLPSPPSVPDFDAKQGSRAAGASRELIADRASRTAESTRRIVRRDETGQTKRDMQHRVCNPEFGIEPNGIGQRANLEKSTTLEVVPGDTNLGIILLGIILLD